MSLRLAFPVEKVKSGSVCHVSRLDSNSHTELLSSATVLLHIVAIAREKGRIAGTSMAMTSGSRSRLTLSF
jgi:hypothetical protein